jgi:hypothetical protein
MNYIGISMIKLNKIDCIRSKAFNSIGNKFLMKNNLIIPNIKNPTILILSMQLISGYALPGLHHNGGNNNKRIPRHNIKLPLHNMTPINMQNHPAGVIANDKLLVAQSLDEIDHDGFGAEGELVGFLLDEHVDGVVDFYVVFGRQRVVPPLF